MKKIYINRLLKAGILCLLTGLYSYQVKANYLVVAKDGSGNYITVQAAIDASPANTTAASPDTIYIKNGRYKEKITIPANKPFVQLIGQSVTGVILTYDDYAAKVTACGVTVGTQNSASVSINANDFTAINITFENSYGDGSQAVAVLINADRAAFKNCRFQANQDTLYTKGNGTPRAYFSKCYIDGNIDFIFGSSVAVFDSCVVYAKSRTTAGSSFITAPNTPSGQAFGYVFRNSKFPSNTGTTSYFLSRPWPSPSEAATRQKTVLLNCILGGSINPAGWTTWDANTVTANITYAEFQSRNFDGTLVDVSQRVSWSKQFTAADTAGYNLPNMFSGWDPCTTRADFCAASVSPIAVSNFKAAKGTSTSQLSWNISWPISGVNYQLFRSTDGVSYSQVYQTTSTNDTAVNFAYTDNAIPASGSVYYYYIAASKAGYASHITDTIQLSNVPTITVSGFLCDFQSYAGTASTTQTYTVSGSNLTGNILVTPPANYEVSLNGSTWYNNASPLSLPPTSGSVATTSVLVRLNAATPGTYSGNITHTTTGTTLIANELVNGTTLAAPTIQSFSLQQYPLTTNGNDSVNVRDPGVNASMVTFNKIVLSDGSQVATIPAYSPTYGMAYGANSAAPASNGSWATAAGGPGGNLNRSIYQQYTVTAKTGYSVRLDSIVLTHNFYATASNLKLAIAYSKNGFTAPADSADVAGATFALPTAPLQNNNGPATVYRFAFKDTTGVTLAAGEALYIRLYNACGSTSAGRYGMLKSIVIKGKSTAVLPLTLLNFTGSYGTGGTKLTWQTNNETNTKDFTIERSADNRSFSSIGQVESRNISGVNTYQFTDGLPLNDITYYRLKTTDKDGKSIYSKIVVMNSKLAGGLRVYPNPAKDDITVAHTKAGNNAMIELMAADGRKLVAYKVAAGALLTPVNISRLPVGIYRIVYTDEEHKSVTQLNKN